MSLSSAHTAGAASARRSRVETSVVSEETDFFREALTGCARRFGAAPALVRGADGRQISYRELPVALSARKGAWSAVGWTQSRRGGVYGRRVEVDDPWEALLDLLAAAWAGVTVLPLNGRWPGPRWLAFLAEFCKGSHAKWASRREIWWPESDSPDSPDSPGPWEYPGPGSLLATSGSTGEPKLAHHTWRAHWANATGAATVLPLEPGDAWAVNLPLWHASGWGAVMRCLQGGAAAVVFPGSGLPGPGVPSITHLSLVATQLKRALDGSEGLPGGMESCRGLLVGGGPVPAVLRERAIQKGWPLHVTYGMTETASQICTTGCLRAARPEVSGPALPGREVRCDREGQLFVHGEVLATGYWHPHRGLEAPWRESGWLATGDVGEWVDGDQGGWLITGRRDRRFICAGENIHPERIEAVLLGLPGIRRVVVVPREDAEYGGRPTAFIDGAGSLGEWQEQAREQLTGLEMPVAWWRWPADSGVGEKPSLEYFRQVLARATDAGYSLPQHV